MISSRHRNLPKFRTCNKGNNVIDALCSSSLLSCIHTSTYEPFMFTTSSDHRGIFIDFNTKQLLGKQETMTSPERRGLNANNHTQIEKFLEHLQKSWKTSDITNRIKLASSSISNANTLRTTLNAIDHDITKQYCKPKGEDTRPKDLHGHQLSNKLVYWPNTTN